MLQMNIFESKSKNMHGHTVFLMILGLHIAGIEAPNKKIAEVMPLTIDRIEGLNITPIPMLGPLDAGMTTTFFTQESQLFLKVEKLYDIDAEKSTSALIHIKPPKKERKKYIFALAHITYLIFWMAMDFRICHTLFLYFEHDNREELKTMCHSYFKEMNFTFREFRKQLKEFIENKKIKGEPDHQAIKWVTELSLDLVSDEVTLLEQRPDKYSKGILKWTNNTNCGIHLGIGADYKTLFSDNAVLRNLPHTTIEDAFLYLYEAVDGEIDWENHLSLCKRFKEQILEGSVPAIAMYFSIYTPSFHNSMQMWKYLLEQNITFNSDDESSPKRRIKKVLKIMKKIRQVIFTIIMETISLTPPPQPEEQ